MATEKKNTKVVTPIIEEIPRQSTPASPNTAAPAKASKSRDWMILGIISVVAVLVVLEVFVMLKQKVDRQRTLTVTTTFGERGGAMRPQSFQGTLMEFADAKGRLFLVDQNWAKVVVWDIASGNFLMSLDAARSQREGFSPVDVSSDPNGNIFVLDRIHLEVTAFSPTGDFIQRWPVSGAGGIAVGPKGDVFVSDNNKNQIVKYSPQGKELLRFSGPGKAKGLLSNPNRMAADELGNVYVLDFGNKRIQVFTSDGKRKAAWALKSDPDVLAAIAYSNHEIYVNDFSKGFIWVYSTAGKLVGQLMVSSPSTLAVDKEGNIFLPASNGIARYVQKMGK